MQLAMSGKQNPIRVKIDGEGKPQNKNGGQQ